VTLSLPVIKELSYISPSAFEESRRCEHLFYLKRLGPTPFVVEPAGLAAQRGSAFDCYVKAGIRKELGQVDNHQEYLQQLIAESVDPGALADSIPFGQRAYNEYKRFGLLDSILKEGIHTVELDKKCTISDGENSVPVFVRPDAVTNSGVIVDWKVSGAASKSGVSPKPGYKWSYTNGVRKGPHALYGAPLEEIEPYWARQLSMYTWAHVGLLPFRDIPVAIELVTVRGDKITFSQYRTMVLAPFQEKLWKALVGFWNRAIVGQTQGALPDKRKCFMWGQVCPVADYCEAFQKVKNNF